MSVSIARWRALSGSSFTSVLCESLGASVLCSTTGATRAGGEDDGEDSCDGVGSPVRSIPSLAAAVELVDVGAGEADRANTLVRARALVMSSGVACLRSVFGGIFSGREESKHLAARADVPLRALFPPVVHPHPLLGGAADLRFDTGGHARGGGERVVSAGGVDRRIQTEVVGGG